MWAEAFKRAIPHVFDTLPEIENISEIESISYHTNATRFSHVPILCSERSEDIALKRRSEIYYPHFLFWVVPAWGSSSSLTSLETLQCFFFFFHLTWLWGGRVGVMLRLCDGLWSFFYVLKPHLWDEFNKGWEAGAGFYPFYLLFPLLGIRNWKRKYIDWVLEQNNIIIGWGIGLRPNLIPSLPFNDETAVLRVSVTGIHVYLPRSWCLSHYITASSSL